MAKGLKLMNDKKFLLEELVGSKQFGGEHLRKPVGFGRFPDTVRRLELYGLLNEASPRGR